MACINHAFTQPGCLACQVSSIGQEQQATAREVQRSNALQAESLEYQAEATAHAEATRYATERQSANTASYEFSMWHQSANGQYWNTWALQAEEWLARATEYENATHVAWRTAAVSVEEWKKLETGKSEAEVRLWVCVAGLGFGVVGFIIGHIIQFFFGTGKVLGSIAWFMTPVCKWMVPVFAIALPFFFIKDLGRIGSVESQAGNTPGAREIEEKYGANPFTDPLGLPSLRPGMTQAQAEAAIDRVRSLARPRAGFYPAPGQLPKLPPLTIRDISDWPPVAVRIIKKRLNLS